jgi:perosamine synthetase
MKQTYHKIASVIPNGRQWIDEKDIGAVVDVLRSDWITTGKKIEEFEQAISDFIRVENAVAVSSGTAALHAAMYAATIGVGDEVILPPITFVATANAVVFQGGNPVFADVDPDTLLIDPDQVVAKISPRTKAIIAVDFAGQPCDYDRLRQIADEYNLILISDACHSLGAEYKGRKVGTLADFTVFSFHPVKHITTGEGGMIVTRDRQVAEKLRCFRNHGINSDHYQRALNGTWYYEMQDLGYNYRLTDFQCALGILQLAKLPAWIKKRRSIARQYHDSFAEMNEIEPLEVQKKVKHAYHLYVIRLDPAELSAERNAIFSALRNQNIGVNVHYIPVHLHPFYRQRFNTEPGLCPIAESSYEQILSLPIFPRMSDQDIRYVIATVKAVIKDIKRY